MRVKEVVMINKDGAMPKNAIIATNWKSFAVVDPPAPRSIFMVCPNADEENNKNVRK